MSGVDIVPLIVTPIVESLMVPVKKHIGYLISCTRYMRSMHTKKRELDATRLGVENRIHYNKSNNLEVPPEAYVWLKEAEEIDAKMERIPNNIGTCFNLKVRHNLGRTAFKIIDDIKNLVETNSKIIWTDHQIPLAKVDSMKASTSTPSSHSTEFESREFTFRKALKILQPNHKSHMIALCGMGGVGKTTMMQKLKTIVNEKKMFDYVVEAAIGEKTNPKSIQQAVAEFLGIGLKEETKEARAAKLCKAFGVKSEEGKKKFLVILDDVWQFVDMSDIGLSPLANRGIDFKVLLTSRNRDVCIQMGVEVDSILRVEVLTDIEARSFFYQFVRSSDDANLALDLRKIGDDIAIRCHGLPIAIKTIAITLKDKPKFMWENARSRLEHHDNVVHEIFEMSYKNIHEEETRSTLLLCVLFPEDSDIPIEDMVRYGWGLKLFEKVYTIWEARNRLNAYIEQLIDANLLIRSQVAGYFKMHDLVRAFVLDMCSKGEHASICTNMSTWHSINTSESCKRISLTCHGMSEFPSGFNCPNLSFFKLMHEYKSLKFPAGFYENTKKLEVIVFEELRYPLLPISLQFSPNLRTLCLHKCSLMLDFSAIGNILNLEVLSFSNCDIDKLPSFIGNLKELKLLDLTDCVKLCIDDGVLEKLVKLEELYMRVKYGNGIRFTNTNNNELVKRAKNLLALEIEFFDTNAFPKNISFKNLERFKISLGCYLKGNDFQNKRSFDNTLSLVTNKCELLNSGVNVLFEKTEVLYLQVDDIYDLGDVLVESMHQQGSSFYNLRVLDICKCANLKYLFTAHMAQGLARLESLTVSQCPVLETLVDSKNNGIEVIKFQALKFLSLVKLPNLTSFCNDINVIELQGLEKLVLDELPNFDSIYPNNQFAVSSKSNATSPMQSFLNKEVVISQLKILEIRAMEKLKEIWPSQCINSEEVSFSTLREIKVEECGSIVNLFPRNPMSLLLHLENIVVRSCSSIIALFDIDEGCVHEMEGGNSNLKNIEVAYLWNLRELWRVNGIDNSNLPILGFQAVEEIYIRGCTSLRNLITPTVVDLHMRALKRIVIDGIDGWGEHKSDNGIIKRSQEKEINVISNKEIIEVEDNIPNAAFPSYLIHTFHHLQTLQLSYCKGMEVTFDLESSSSRMLATTRDNQPPLLLPHLKELRMNNMVGMTHVWKYMNLNAFLMSRQEQKSSFHNLTNISLVECRYVKYLFSPLIAKLLSNLKMVTIHRCDAIEEVASYKDNEDEETDTFISSKANTTFFSRLSFLDLLSLPCLERVDGSIGTMSEKNKLTSNTTISTHVHDKVQGNQVGVSSWSLYQYLKKIKVIDCNVLLNVIPSQAAGQLLELEELIVYNCPSMVEIFEIERFNNDVGHNNVVGEGSGVSGTTMTIPRITDMNLLELSNLKEVYLGTCPLLMYIFTSSTLESLKKLEKLSIQSCEALQVIVKEENTEHKIASKDVVFPSLKSISLFDLPNLKGFFLGKNDFKWPLLDTVEIHGCPQMTTFTSGKSVAPNLHYIHTDLGKHSLECGLNFDWTNVTHENKSSVCSTPEILQFPWSMSNLVEVDIERLDKLSTRITHFPCDEFHGKQKEDEAFEVVERTNDELIKTQSDEPYQPKRILKSNWWISSNLSNLTKVSISDQHILGHVFCYCVVGSLFQLQSLHIRSCYRLEVIVKQVQDSETKGNRVVFPCLKSLKLSDLRCLKAFYLGMEAFQWPSLDTLEIEDCPRINVFTNEQSTTQKLKMIRTSFGLCEIKEDVNSFIRTKREEGYEF